MIIVKVINQRLVQVAIAGQPMMSSVLAARNRKQIVAFARTLVQSTSQQQKITSANNQQLIPIARNISFRQCKKTDSGRSLQPNAFSITGSNQSTAHYITANLDTSIFSDHLDERESPLEVIKKRAPDVREKRDVAPKKAYYGQSFHEPVAIGSERRLVVLMSWLEAKEKHIEKYRQFYLDRGFDVLNVKTSPWDLLLPGMGALKISRDFVRFMVEKQYSDVLLHGFSVGGYMFGQVLLEIDQQEDKVKQDLHKSIRGIVFDSLVPLEGTCVGVARSITKNPIGAKCLEHLLRLYLLLGQRIATKYYLAASDKVWGGPLKVPSLFLMSKDDVISDYKIVERLIKVWSNLGIETHKMVVESSPHVQIFNKHHDAYVGEVEKFLKHIKMN